MDLTLGKTETNSQQEPLNSSNHDLIIAPELARFNVPLPDLLQSYNTDATHLATGVLVFNTDGKVLVIQRSENDSMAGKWEIPGGGCDFDDISILHAAARELEEETGLRAKSFKRVIGDGYRFATSRGLQILRLTFEAEVDESGLRSPTSTQHNTDNYDYSTTPASIRLDPKEHQNWLWCSESEVASGESGETRLEFTTQAQKDLILFGFARKEEGESRLGLIDITQKSASSRHN